MPYTIYHLDGERGLRGGERQLLTLAGYLHGRGHRNVIACRRGSELESEAGSRGLEVLGLPFYFEWDPVSAWKLRGRLRAESRPILHAHTGHAAALAWLAGQGSGAVRVAHRRVDFQVRNRWSLRLKYASADKVIAITETVKRKLIESGMAEPDRIVVVPSALGTEPLDYARTRSKEACRRELSQELGLPLDERWIGTLSALVPEKDHATLLDAAPRVLSERPGTRLLIAGSGPLEGKLKTHAARLGISDRVLFLGWREDNLRIMRALDLFVLNSRMEGMGSVLLEALASATPIVAAMAGGIPEVVRDGIEAVLVPASDAGALADGMLRLLSDPSLCARLAAAGALRLQEFSAERMGQRTEAIYEELLSKKEGTA